METSISIREAVECDLSDVLSIERAAFGEDEEAELVRKLLEDPSAQPILSLLAFQNDRPVGHILFTAARLIDSPNPASIVLLAPLAVVPDAQRRGIGGQLIGRGLQVLSNSGVDLVFVLGHPEYYPRYGFQPAGCLGFEASYPIPDRRAHAWMVRSLRPDVIGSVRGKVMCADALARSEYWIES